MKILETLTARLSPQGALWLNRLVSLGLGLLTAVIMHYVLYRIALPSTPFIYVAF
jgi:hypothetical protein